VQDRLALEELLRKLHEFEKAHEGMNPDTRREFEDLLRMAQNRLAKATSPQQ
jgi:hypothetical protein